MGRMDWCRDRSYRTRLEHLSEDLSWPKAEGLRLCRHDFNATQPGDQRFVRIIVRNVGTAPTTITLYSIHSFKGFRSRFRKTELNAARSAILNEYSGPQCPARLQVGEEVNVFMKQDTRFEEWLKEELWVGVHHPFAKGAVLAKVVKSERIRVRSPSQPSVLIGFYAAQHRRCRSNTCWSMIASIQQENKSAQ